jgi:hypothetical protein
VDRRTKAWRQLASVEAGSTDEEGKQEVIDGIVFDYAGTPQCHICSADDERKALPNGAEVKRTVDAMLVRGATYASILAAIAPQVQDWPKPRRPSYFSVRRHQLRHLPVDRLAIREVLERRAVEQGLKIAVGRGPIVTNAAVLEVIRDRGLEAVPPVPSCPRSGTPSRRHGRWRRSTGSRARGSPSRRSPGRSGRCWRWCRSVSLPRSGRRSWPRWSGAFHHLSPSFRRRTWTVRRKERAMAERKRGPHPPGSNRPGPSGILGILRESLASIGEVLDVVRFAEEILGLRLYPVQKTILRLIFLDLEHMSAFDRRLVDGWRGSFARGGDVIGVPPHIWDQVDWLRAHGYWHFRIALLLLGRRGGKGFLGAIASSYLIYRLIKMGSPQGAMGIDLDKDIVAFVSATNKRQSADNAFTDLATTLGRVPFFERWLASTGADEIRLRTPGDLERDSEARRQGRPGLDRASIVIRAISSSAPAARGPAGFMAWFDELAHTAVTPSGARSGEELYHAVVPALAQAKQHALILATTSPWTQTGPAFEIYEQARAVDERTGDPANPDILVVQLTSFDPYSSWDDLEATEGRACSRPIIVFNDIMEREEARNRSTFRVEHRSQWAAVREAFLEADVVERVFLPYCPTCGHSFPEPEWRAGNGRCPWCSQVVTPITPETHSNGVPRYLYRGHADPAEGHDNFACCIAHLQPFTEPDGTPTVHVIVDRPLVWIPQGGRPLPYPSIQAELAQVISRFPNMRAFSYDQFGAMATIQGMEELLRERRLSIPVVKHTHTQAGNRETTEIVKEALANNWIHAPRDALGPDGSCLLELEMKFLQLHNMRLIKPTSGPVRTDDLWTAFATVSWKLLKDHHGRGIRKALGAAPLAVGLPGGYHTGGIPEETVRPRRRRRGMTSLEEFGRSVASGEIQFWARGYRPH